MKDRFVGKKNPFYGKHHTKESIEKRLSTFKKNYKKENHYWYNKPRYGKDNPNYGNHRFVGKNNPMYGIHRYGENAPNFGKKLSEETKKKLSKNHANVRGKNNPRSKKIICLETLRVFPYINYLKNKFSIMSIIMCCKHYKYHHTSGSYHWMYFSEWQEMSKKEQNKYLKERNVKI